MGEESRGLHFSIDILDAYFSSSGRYFLRLSIQGTHGDKRAVKLYVNKSKDSLQEFEFTTGVCRQNEDLEIPVTFTDSLRFVLPPTFIAGEVKLLVEAFCLPEDPMLDGEKVGEAVFIVYPRTTSVFPRVKPQSPPTDGETEVYSFETQLALTQALGNEGITINTGMLEVLVSLTKKDEPIEVLPHKPAKSGSEAKTNVLVSSDRSAEVVGGGTVEEFENSIGGLNRVPALNKEGRPSDRNSNHELSGSLLSPEYSFRQEQAGSLANVCPRLERTADADIRWLERQRSKEVVDVSIERSMESDPVRHMALPDESYVGLAGLGITAECGSPTQCINKDTTPLIKQTRKWLGNQENRKMQVKAETLAQEGSYQQLEEAIEPQQVPLLPIPEELSAPGPSSAPQAESVPTTPHTASGIRKITDSPLPGHSSGVPVQNLCGSCVARDGYCDAVILIHGAMGLPTASNGRLPQPYITGKSRKQEVQRLSAQSVSHLAVQPTHSPVWEELLLVEFQEEQVKEEEIILSIADHPSKELLTEYRIPVNHLKPFHQYHLELVQPSAGLAGDTRLYVTLILKKDKLLLLPGAAPKMCGLEVVLRGVESPLVSQMGPLMAVARVVSDWRQYKEAMLVPKPRPAGVTMTTIHFPSPHPTSFVVAGAAHAHGAPLVTVGGTPQEQPQWNQTVFFPGNEADMFTATTALVIEYYPASLTMSQSTWQMTRPVGYSHHSLDRFLLSNLQHDNGKLGLKLDGLLIEGSRLKTHLGSCPSVGLVLRLVMSEQPDPLMSAAHLASLPAFRRGPPAQPGDPQLSAQADEQNPYGLPPMDAVRNILPRFISVYQAPSPVPQDEYSPLKYLSPEGERTLDEQGPSRGMEARGTIDSRTITLLDAQMKEVDRYRTAMRTLATDLLHVRQECKRLEEANSRLRRELAHHDEISHLMITSQDLDHVTHSELVHKFVLLKKKLADESTKKQEMQQRLQHLQNDLIKKNETEKKYLKLQEAHEGQQALLQKLQGKIKKTSALQEACKKQEKVIVQLEQLMVKQGQGNLTREDNGVHPTLSGENVRLQSEVLHYKELLQASRAKQEHSRSSPAARNEPLGDQERLDLYQKLDKSEGRILGLEKQLTENARIWAKKKAELQMKLNESLMAQQTGYRNSFSDLHDLDGPKPTSPGQWSETRRRSPKLDPLDRRY